MSSAYQKGLSQISNRRPQRFTRYRDGAIVGQTFAPTLKTDIHIPEWTAWAGGGLVGFILGIIIGRR